ncbi:unnamed protein product [Gongylonema pulchrum]|uniref:Myosin_tail_1 domain-containing protein n=1 Tax=Gongylonema pulchrum TaxID=637853 RepID=A0A183E519_9BILA|nr:unnamed protein product [Gongylonema pulchrum]
MDELMETKGEVAKYKTDVESLTRQVSLLRTIEKRQQQELNVLRERSYSSEKMTCTLKQLEIRLQRIDEKKIQGLEEQLTAAKNENESLKKFVGEITEQHRSFSLDLKMMLNKVQTERDQALASRKSVEDQLSLKEREVSGLQARYDDLMNQMKSLDSASDDAGHREEMHQLRSRISYLENRLTVVSRELEASNKQLAIRECEIAEISKLSSSMETTILEQGANIVAERNSLQSMLDVVKEQLAESVATVESLRAQIGSLEQQANEQANTMAQQKLAFQKELHCFQEQMNDLNILKAKADSRVSEIEANCAKILAEKTAVEEECDRLGKEVSRLEQEMHVKETELVNVRSNAAQFEQRCEDVRHDCASEVAVLRVENDRLEEELRKANALVEEQKQKLELVGENLVKQCNAKNAY